MTALTPTGSGSYDPARTFGNYTYANAVQANAARSQASDIVIHTLEGDTVTLSSSTYNAGGFETYESLAASKGAYAYRYGETAYFESRRQMSTAVTGDLNQEELKDISEILGTLDDMMQDLTAGNLESALSRSSSFAALDSIASFSADLNVTATFTASRYESLSASTSVPGTEDEESDAIGRIDQAADRISRALGTRTALLKNLVPKIEESFSDWFEKASEKSNDQAKGMKWASRFAQRLMDGLKPDLPHEKG
jgi:hypothetical protein